MRSPLGKFRLEGVSDVDFESCSSAGRLQCRIEDKSVVKRSPPAHFAHGRTTSAKFAPTSPATYKRQRTGDSPCFSKVAADFLSFAAPSPDARNGWADDFPTEFEIGRRVGEGTFSTVWAARPRGGEGVGGSSVVALKRINPTCSPSRILNEFEQMRKLGGKCNVVEVLKVLRTPGGAFVLVMPFFEHDDFRQVIKTVTLSAVAAYMRSLLTALAHVHAEGIIHRDIKPRNFMYNSASGQGLLIDFGLAEPADRWRSRSAALAKHRDKRAREQASGRPPKDMVRGASQTLARASRPPSHQPDRARRLGTAGRGTRGGTADRAPHSEEGSQPSWAGAGGYMEDNHDLLRKVERGGTTGFRAPEILWHSREQEPAVDIWSAGVILLCLLSRRYPVFPLADNDEMALVQVAAVIGAEDVVRAARTSGGREIVEMPSMRGHDSSLNQLCTPLLGGEAYDEPDRVARDGALSLLRAMLMVEPGRRISARDALMHPFVVEA